MTEPSLAVHFGERSEDQMFQEQLIDLIQRIRALRLVGCRRASDQESLSRPCCFFSTACVTIGGRCFARVVEECSAEVRRAGEAELMTHLLHGERRVVEQSLGLPDFQLIEVGHDSATEGVAEEFFGSCGTRPDLAGNLADAQAVAYARQEQATDLFGDVEIGVQWVRIAAQSLLDLTQNGEQSSGQREWLARLFGGEVIRDEPKAVMQFAIAGGREAMQAACV